MTPSVHERPRRRAPAAGRRARGALAQSWSDFHALPALYCAPGVVLALTVGLMAGQPGAALLAGAGAFSAGFGAFQRLSPAQLAPMVLATLCMSLSTAVGTVASGDPYAAAAVVALAAFTLGLAAAFGTGPWWVLLQGAIFLVIAGAHPGGWRDGLARALAVLAGGLGQSLLVGALRRLGPRGFPPLSGPNASPPPDSAAAWAREARRVLSPAAPEFTHALLLGLAAGAAVLLARRLAAPNGYWAALTVLLVLRRGGGETLLRGVQRIGGTVLGAVAATLLAAVLRPDSLGLLALIGGAAWCAYATQWVNYGTFSLSATSYIVFLLALLGLPEAEVALHRVAATVLGSAIAFAALVPARLVRRAAEQRSAAAP